MIVAKFALIVGVIFGHLKTHPILLSHIRQSPVRFRVHFNSDWNIGCKIKKILGSWRKNKISRNETNQSINQTYTCRLIGSTSIQSINRSIHNTIKGKKILTLARKNTAIQQAFHNGCWADFSKRTNNFFTHETGQMQSAEQASGFFKSFFASAQLTRCDGAFVACYAPCNQEISPLPWQETDKWGIKDKTVTNKKRFTTKWPPSSMADSEKIAPRKVYQLFGTCSLFMICKAAFQQVQTLVYGPARHSPLDPVSHPLQVRTLSSYKNWLLFSVFSFVIRKNAVELSFTKIEETL